MDRENCNLMMAGTIQGNGRIIKCMGLENCTMKMVKLHIKDTGRMISFAGKEEFLMIDPKDYQDLSITMILLTWEESGYIIKENSKVILNTVKGK